MIGKYVLITPARNEEVYIEKTIKSVISQSKLPLKWIIVSDNSKDKTDEIVESYISQYNYIQLLKTSGEKERSFGSKAKVVMYAYNQIKDLEFDFIGNLDADVSCDSNYYENILLKFQQNPNLGCAGGVRFDFCKNSFKKVNCAPNSVGGPFQMFTKECFEQIGGYKSLKYGGIDAAAEITVRKLGWEVRSFPDLKLLHHRCTGSEMTNPVKYSIQNGLKLYSLGYHPLFVCGKYIVEVFNKPFFLSSILSLISYFWALTFGFKKELSKSTIKFLRDEQMQRIKDQLK